MLIQRLVANPHDEEALAYAHRAGTVDPRSYAILLEKVGQATADPAYAAHWLSEAANVWSTTIGDAHHAARTLMIAIEKDPTARTASERLAQLYRDKGDLKALVALLERIVKSLAPLVNERPDVRPHLVAMHEELGRLWSDQPFSRPERALENWRRVAELDPQQRLRHLRRARDAQGLAAVGRCRPVLRHGAGHRRRSGAQARALPRRGRRPPPRRRRPRRDPGPAPRARCSGPTTSP